MPISLAVPSTVGCNACRDAVIRFFVFPSMKHSVIAARASWTASQPLNRSFTTPVARRARKNELPPPDIEPDFDVLESEKSPSAAQREITVDFTRASQSTENEFPPSSSPSQYSPMPWYLQSQHTPAFATPPERSAHSAIPDLPPHPPPLLSTLLDYLSLTAGLDDLALLDLRNLDPPPALGPKLIMIMGTARSEKHLHVSADRFCRYLRREHGLRANAAGLLGRNELKIKLRRKTKRMRMLANIGGQEPEGNIDDGIRTGWICCTLEKIQAHSEDMHIPGVDIKGIVGFRDARPGVNVVVQMFTEEKRGEIDLETLWGGVLRTQERDYADAEGNLKEMDRRQDDAEMREGNSREWTKLQTAKAPISLEIRDTFPEDSSTKQWKRPLPSKGDLFPPASNSSTTRQIRRLHSVGLDRSS